MTVVGEITEVTDRGQQDVVGDGRLRRVGRALAENWITIVAALVLIVIVVVPLVGLFVTSLREGTPASPGEWTLDHYKAVYASSQMWQALWNTVIYAFVTSAASLMIAGVLAWLLERTDMPGRGPAWVMMLLPIAMPGMLSSMAWMTMLAERQGVVNVAARDVLSVFGIEMTTGPFNINSMWGMLFVESVRGSTTLFLMMVAAFKLMDPSLEEAAGIAGASPLASLRRITAPLLMPTLLATAMYGFINNLDDFETPLLIGLRAKIFLLPTLIYFTANVNGDWGMAATFSTIFIALTVIMVVIYHRVIIRRVDQFATISGKAFRPRRVALGRWRWPAFGLFVVYFMFAVGFPLLILLWAALLPVYEPPSMDALGRVSLDKFSEVFSDPMVTSSLWNSLELALGAGAITMVLAFLISWSVVRQRVRGGAVLDALTFIPNAIPSVAIVVATVAFYLNPSMHWLPLYGTTILMAMVMVTRHLAFASRSTNGAMSQIDRSLEEAAYASGARKLRVLLKINTPLLAPAFLGGFIYIAAASFRNLTVPLMMAPRDKQTIATALYYYWNINADFSGAAAIGVLLVIALAVFAILARRIIVRGYSGHE